MILFFDKSTYNMPKKQVEGVIEFARKRVSFGIYAIEKKKAVELKNEPYETKESLEKAIKAYEEQGFKVYYNGGADDDKGPDSR